MRAGYERCWRRSTATAWRPQRRRTRRWVRRCHRTRASRAITRMCIATGPGERAKTRQAWTAIATALGGRAPGRMLVLGAGAGRLAYDVHHESASSMTVAAGHQSVVRGRSRGGCSHGERVELYEFPVAPRDVGSNAVLRQLAAPAPGACRPAVRARGCVASAFCAGSLPDRDHALAGRCRSTRTRCSLPDSVNGLLAPDGRWISTGTLFFAAARCCRIAMRLEEVVAKSCSNRDLAACGCAKNVCRTCSSPASRHARIEEVVTFVATKVTGCAGAIAAHGFPSGRPARRALPLLPAVSSASRCRCACYGFSPR